MSYQTDEEKVEAIKAWWKENGLSIIAGALIGLGAIFSWRFWVDHRESVAREASAALEQLLDNAQQADAAAVAKQAELLQDEYGATPYAAFSALVAAKALYDAGQAAAAISALELAIDQAKDPAFARIAALRLARIQVAEGQLDAAEQTLAAHAQGDAFAGDIAAVRGDIAAARGDTAAARSAFELAIERGSGLTELLRLKLDNLPATTSTSTPASTPAPTPAPAG